MKLIDFHSSILVFCQKAAGGITEQGPAATAIGSKEAGRQAAAAAAAGSSRQQHQQQQQAAAAGSSSRQ